MKKIIITELKRQQKACGYSWAGLKMAWQMEASFRTELILAIIFLSIASFLDVGLLEKAVLIFSILLILVVEIINSAIENTVELVCKEYNPTAKIAKDQGSAAVLIAIINMLVIWTLILVNRFL